MNHTSNNILNPENFQIDAREFSDLIMVVKELSKNVHFYNTKNKIDGNWHDLLASDESFLLAEILKFDIAIYDSKRLNLIKKYDDLFTIEDKKKVFVSFFKLLFSLLNQVNNWYLDALKNNLDQQSSLIELELESAIQNKLSKYLNQISSYYNSFSEEYISLFEDGLNFEPYAKIWDLNNLEKRNIFSNGDNDLSRLNNALKNLILIYTPIYEVVFHLKDVSNSLFNNSLTKNDNHKSHVGLLFAFFDLFKILQKDLNNITKKHLDLFFKTILGQKPRSASPDRLFAVFQIDQYIKSLNLENNSVLKVGQYDDGSDILFSINNSIYLNNIRISKLMTFFLNRNSSFEYNSNYNLVSGIYSKTHADSIKDSQDFNNNELLFSTLGEDQKLLLTNDMSMDISEVGFIIASPTLKMNSGDRSVTLDFYFTVESINFLSNLIIDISNIKDLSEEDIFYEVFSKAFIIEYTSDESWFQVEEYSIEYPDDWSIGRLTITFKLNKLAPPFSTYNPQIHEHNIDTNHPVLKLTLNQNEFYNPYSFLSSMQLSKIEIKVLVSQLKKIYAFGNSNLLDVNSEFEIFGSIPKKGSYILIGSDELFNKKIETIGLRWKYINLPSEYHNFDDYYANYNRNISNESFKIKLSALSDFKYSRIGSEDLIFNLFERNTEGNLSDTRIIKEFSSEPLKLKPNYNLKSEALEVFDNDAETGFLKLELIEPSIGFGFDIYQKVLNESITKATENQVKKKGVGIKIEQPNNPFSPLISDISIDYESHTKLIFNQSEYHENDFEQKNAFFLISPFGIEKTFSENAVSKTDLIYNFLFEGEIVIGLENVNTPEQLNLLFEIKKSENTNYEFSRKLEWFYSSYNGWKPFKTRDIFYDETINLMKTGVISFMLPKDMTDKNGLFNNEKFYIKACSKNKADQFSLIKSIRTNAISAIEIIGEAFENKADSIAIPANSIEGLKEPKDGVINIEQPFKSISGRPKESEIEFYTRVSQLLRHKNRPVTSWDYEKFVLNTFDWLSHAKCFPNTNNSQNKLDNFKMVCLKKIEPNQNIEEVTLNSAEILEIKNYINNYTSPFAKISIINPIFEDIWVKCHLIFTQISPGQGMQKLNKDFFQFICPWIKSTNDIVQFGGRLKKIEILNFIKSRKYISFVTGISIVHIKKLEDGSQVIFDSARDTDTNDFIECGTPWSLLVPKNNNQINLLESEVYKSPEPMDFDELTISGNFLIDNTEESQVFKEEENKPSEALSEFIFKLKF